MQSNMLCLALTLDGRTLAVGTRTGEVHLWSTLACSCPSLKSCCRATINSQRGSKRRQIRQMFLSSHLINYLMYKDDTIKWLFPRHVVFLFVYIITQLTKGSHASGIERTSSDWRAIHVRGSSIKSPSRISGASAKIGHTKCTRTRISILVSRVN